MNMHQQDTLVNAVESNPVLLTKKFSTIRAAEQYKQDWEDLTTQLNAVGQQKSVQQWKKTLHSWVFRIKAKISNNKKVKAQSGGKAIGLQPLSEYEQRLIEVKGFISTNGDRGVYEAGFGKIEELSMKKRKCTDCMVNKENIEGYDIYNDNENMLVEHLDTDNSVNDVVLQKMSAISSISKSTNIISSSQSSTKSYDPTSVLQVKLSPNPFSSFKNKEYGSGSHGFIPSSTSGKTSAIMYEENVKLLTGINNSFSSVTDVLCQINVNTNVMIKEMEKNRNTLTSMKNSIDEINVHLSHLVDMSSAQSVVHI